MDQLSDEQQQMVRKTSTERDEGMGVDLHQKVGDQIGKLLVQKTNFF